MNKVYMKLQMSSGQVLLTKLKKKKASSGFSTPFGFWIRDYRLLLQVAFTLAMKWVVQDRIS